MSLPRILYVGTFPPHPGGTGVINGYLLKGLHDAGYPLSVVAPASRGRAAVVGRLYPNIALAEVPITLSPNAPWLRPMDDPEKLTDIANLQAAFTEIAERFNPEIVFTGREDFLESVLPWTLRRGLPVVCRAPGSGALMADTYGAAARRAMFDLVGKADIIIAPALHVAAGLAKNGFRNIVTIQNPVDMARFRSGPIDRELAARFGLTSEHVVVAHVSNLKPVKRVQDIVAAAAQAVGRDPRLVFLVIGDGPDRKQLEEAILESELNDHFRFTDWVDHAAVPGHLRLADMALMPSSAEGLSSAYLEAMATGLPLLASDIAAAREVIDPGNNGFLFSVGDVDAIADLIVNVAADPHLRQRVRSNARAYVEQNHRLEAAGDLLREVVADVVRQGRAVGAT